MTSKGNKWIGKAKKWKKNPRNKKKKKENFSYPTLQLSCAEHLLLFFCNLQGENLNFQSKNITKIS